MGAKPGSSNSRTIARNFSSTPSPAVPRKSASPWAIRSTASSSCSRPPTASIGTRYRAVTCPRRCREKARSRQVIPRSHLLVTRKFSSRPAALRLASFTRTTGGRDWTVAETPVAHGNVSSGIFSIASDGHNHVLVVGGDYQQTRQGERAAAYSLDAGKTWQLAARQPGGFRSALAQIAGGHWIAVGPTGEDRSDDYGVHWKQTGSLNLDALAILDWKHGWAAGAQGVIARFRHP